MVTVCTRLGFAVEHTRGRRTFAIEMGNESLVDNLPGVPGGSSYIGSFDREEAVADETIDFFASGHPLVEGVFAHIEDGQMGRVVRLEVEIDDDSGYGLVALYKDGPGFDVVAHDHSGRNRPDWAAAFRQRPLRARRTTADLDDREWTEALRRLATHLDATRRPYALAAVIVRPER
jgi:ATP-dependent helicase HepA